MTDPTSPPDSSSSGADGAAAAGDDPSNFVRSPPTTHVKIINTARADLNGQVGLVVGYNTGRGRYSVHLLPGQRSATSSAGRQAAADAAAARAASASASGGSSSAAYMSLKPENLIRATLMERLKVQVGIVRLNLLQYVTDPQMREQFRRAYTSIDARLPPPVKPEHAALLVLVAWLLLARTIGLSKAVLLTSLTSLIVMTALPDLLDGRDGRTVVRNFPRRWREAVARGTGFGAVTERQALVGLAVLLLFGMKLLITPSASAAGGGRAATAATTATAGGAAAGDGGGMGRGLGDVAAGEDWEDGAAPPPRGPKPGKQYDLEAMYRLGYEDGKDGKEYGTSLPHLTAETAPRGLDDPLDFPYDPSPVPPQAQQQQQRGSKFGFGTMMAAFTLFRFGKELAVNPEGRFDRDLLVANLRVQPPWKLAIVGFCAYTIVSAFF